MPIILWILFHWIFSTFCEWTQQHTTCIDYLWKKKYYLTNLDTFNLNAQNIFNDIIAIEKKENKIK